MKWRTFSSTASPKVVSADGNPWIDPATTLPNPYFNPAAPLQVPPNLDNIPTFPIPSRQNALHGIPHRYDRLKVNRQINVLLNPTGTVGGNLFQAWFVEVPNGMFAWRSVIGVSAQQFFFPTTLGAYCAVFARGGSGRIVWHFMVEP